MSFTRRTLLRNTAALSAATALAGWSPELLSAQTPAANAVYVLFEGPWLFDPSGTGIRATTLGADMPDGTNHTCEIGIWDPVAKDLTGKFPLTNGSTVALVATNSVAAPSFLKLFTDAFVLNPFLWFANNSPRVTPSTTDRTATFTMPSAAFFSGKLVYPTFADSGNMLKPSALGAPRPFSAAIFAYLPGPSGVVSLSVNGTQLQVPAGSHLILRLRRIKAGVLPPAQDGAHIQAVFNILTTRISPQGPTMNTLTDVDYAMGSSCPITSLPELGLPATQPGKMTSHKRVVAGGHGTLMPMNSNMSNCQGGGGPVGP